MTTPSNLPTVLCISGHDQAGGAGIHADLEAVAAQGAHPLTVITALTVQDSGNVYRVEPVAAPLLDRKSAVSGKSVSVRVDHGGRLIMKKETDRRHAETNISTTHAELGIR